MLLLPYYLLSETDKSSPLLFLPETNEDIGKLDLQDRAILVSENC